MLATGRDVAVTCQPAQWVALAQQPGQCRQAPVLRLREGVFAIAFEFDADRKIIAALTTLELRHTGMPGPTIGPDELTQLATAPDQEMGRDAQSREPGKVRMRTGIERAGEQPFDGIARELSGRQADVMNDQQIDRAGRRALVVVFAGKRLCAIHPAIGPGAPGECRNARGRASRQGNRTKSADAALS